MRILKPVQSKNYLTCEIQPLNSKLRLAWLRFPFVFRTLTRQMPNGTSINLPRGLLSHSLKIHYSLTTIIKRNIILRKESVAK